MRMRSTLKLLIVLLFTLTTASTARALPGDLDPTFSFDGISRDGLGADSYNEGRAGIVQPDGKIVVAGRSQYGSINLTCSLSRYNVDGSIDTSFDLDGQAFVPINDLFFCWAMAVQSDGKIIVAGDRLGDTVRGFGLARFNPDGSLDNSFDGDGRVVTDVGSSIYRLTAIAIQPDGKIVAAGYVFTGATTDIMLVRYNPDGSLDNSFHGDGRVFTTVGTGTDEVHALVIQPDGKIVAGGYAIEGSNVDFVLVRYNPDGILDSSFDEDGRVRSSLPNAGSIEAIALQTDGKIVAAGSASQGTNSDFAVARYNTDGSPDMSFDMDGWVTTPMGTGYDFASDIEIRSDGKIIVAGDREQGDDYDFALARYNTDGSLDNSFDGDGKVITDFPDDASAITVAQQPDGKLVAAGYTGFVVNNIAKYDTVVVRYNSDGTIDTTLDGDGKLISDIGFQNSDARAVAIQSDGKIVVAGYTSNGVNNDISVARYTTNGAFDPTFDGDGRVLVAIFNGHDVGNAIAIQPDGKILVAGAAYNGTNNDFAFIRLNPNGSLDDSFGLGGKVAIPITFAAASDEIANAVAVQPDGKIVAAGSAFTHVSKFALVRLTSGGGLDPTFDGDGTLISPIGGFNASEVAKAIALQPDGKIVAAGGTEGGLVIARFLTNGTPDLSFTVTGNVIFATGGAAEAMVIQPDGKIVTAGAGNLGAPGSNFVLVRVNTNGTPDGTFATNGIAVTNFSGLGSRATSLALGPNGKILAGGFIDRIVPNNDDFALAQYNSNGTLDGSFGDAGKKMIDIFDASTDNVRGVAFDSSGRAVVGGTSNGLFTVARLAGDLAGRNVPFDFDGDSKTDIGIYRPSVGEWWIYRSSTGTAFASQFGSSTDKIVPADYTGDGKTDIAFWRPSTGEWFVMRSEDGSFYSVPFGTAGDIPAPADYDADGRADTAVFRPSTGTWFVQRSTGGTTIQQFGTAGDQPVAADYDGDGRADLAIYRPSAGQWWLNRTTAGTIAYTFGNSTDKLVPADYTGDGKVDVAFWRPATGEWFILRSEDTSYYSAPFGANTDVVVPGDYDGDGKCDLSVFRPSTATWFVNRTTGGTLIRAFGATGDTPIPSAYVP